MADDILSYRSSLSITETDDGYPEDDDQLLRESETTSPLRTRVLQVIKSTAPDFTIRPAKISQELGLSITDASAELCGLLKAVGEGSSFHFEKVNVDGDGSSGSGAGGVLTMVFTFPPDFEEKALKAQRQDDWKETLQDALKITVKVLKVLTAFGLILSTVIVSIAGIVAMVAALVALSRGGGDNRARHHLSRQLHNMFLLLRQLLWCYAMFGPVDDHNNQDPFFREAAYDTWLVLSLCCGNPGSLWFWLRASHLRQRRQRMARGWGRMDSNHYFVDTPSDLEGIRLVRRGAWGQEEEMLPAPAAASSSDEYRGLLSIAVEFLFGPNTPPGPTESERWRLRSAIIVEKSQQKSVLSLQELCPYVDSPPASLQDTAKVVSEGLLIVAHFNGVPSTASKNDKENDTTSPSVGSKIPTGGQALFVFPELVSESSTPTRYYEDLYHLLPVDDDKARWKDLFYISDSTSLSSPSPRSGGNPIGRSSSSLPGYLYEQPEVFTKLASRQFYHCFLVAILNFIGVLWFAQSLEPNGILEKSLGTFGQGLKWSLIPVLQFYAKLFFCIPGVRLLYIVIWNEFFCRSRNQRRRQLAAALKEKEFL